ncbi:MAG TPA: preprotein translocase subunit YajC [bacterium]|nr:preprotein translocase subunit YajC [bacterium]
MWPFLEGTAYAMAPQAGGGEGFASMASGFVPLVLVFAIFWFLVIRPQQKRAKEHRNLVASIKKGDEVYTDGGILGTIQKVAEQDVTLEIAPKVSIRIQRARIADLVKSSKVKESKERGDASDETDDN